MPCLFPLCAHTGPEQAHELGALLQPHSASLNLIPWNPVAAAAAAAAAVESGGGPAPLAFTAPTPERVAAFQAVVRDTVGASACRAAGSAMCFTVLGCDVM